MTGISIALRGLTLDEERIRRLLVDATRHKENKNYDAAIAGLREAYVLMEQVSMEWGYREFFRLPRCLHLAGRYDDAITELRRQHDSLGDFFARRKANGFLEPPPGVQRKMRAMIKREIEVTTDREKSLMARRAKSPI